MRCRWNAGTWGRTIHTLGILTSASLWAACAGTSGVDLPDLAAAGMQHAPVRLDKDMLAGEGLEEYPAEYALEGTTGQRAGELFVGEELAVGVWAAESSRFPVPEHLFDEFIVVLSGKLILTDKHGTATEYSAGESLVLPKGFSGTWQTIGDYREIFLMEKEAWMREGGSD